MTALIVVAIALAVFGPTFAWLLLDWTDRPARPEPSDPQAAEDLRVCEALWRLQPARKK